MPLTGIEPAISPALRDVVLSYQLFKLSKIRMHPYFTINTIYQFSLKTISYFNYKGLVYFDSHTGVEPIPSSVHGERAAVTPIRIFRKITLKYKSLQQFILKHFNATY